MSSSPFLQRLAIYRDALAFRESQPAADWSDKEEVRPRVFPGKLPTVLALHGFTGVPAEVDLIVEAARSLGLKVRAPLLPGHGTHPRDLIPLRFSDWVQGAKDHFDAARAEGPVILAGLSLGSLLCTELYLEAPGDVIGLALLANAFWLTEPFPATALRLVQSLRIRDFGMPKFGADIADPESQRTHVTYPLQPVHAALSLHKAGARLQEELFRVHCPTLLLHGAKDRVCPVANAWKVAERLGTRDSKVVIYPRSHHILTRDWERDQVREDLVQFFRRLSDEVEARQG